MPNFFGGMQPNGMQVPMGGGVAQGAGGTLGRQGPSPGGPPPGMGGMAGQMGQPRGGMPMGMDPQFQRQMALANALRSRMGGGAQQPPPPAQPMGVF